VDIQTLLKESSLLITDYSSIFFDFAYMKKPLLYYQFDEEEFRKRQYEEGYFSYRKDGFGSVVKNEERLVDAINDCIDKNFTTPPLYSKRADKFFALRDKNNSERIYQAILALRQGRG
jgi:CDP-glycerol glycerophosphotransferase (TagB/SpsB family)